MVEEAKNIDIKQNIEEVKNINNKKNNVIRYCKDKKILQYPYNEGEIIKNDNKPNKPDLEVKFRLNSIGKQKDCNCYCKSVKYDGINDKGLKFTDKLGILSNELIEEFNPILGPTREFSMNDCKCECEIDKRILYKMPTFPKNKNSNSNKQTSNIDVESKPNQLESDKIESTKQIGGEGETSYKKLEESENNQKKGGGFMDYIKDYNVWISLVVIISFIIYIIKSYVPFNYDSLDQKYKNLLGYDYDNSKLGYAYYLTNSLVQSLYNQILLGALLTFIIFSLFKINITFPFFILVLISIISLTILLFGIVNIILASTILLKQNPDNHRVFIILAVVFIAITLLCFITLILDIFLNFLGENNRRKTVIIICSIAAILAIITLSIIGNIGTVEQNLLLNKNLYRIVQTMILLAMIYFIINYLKDKDRDILKEFNGEGILGGGGGTIKKWVFIFTSIFTDILTKLGDIDVTNYAYETEGLEGLFTTDYSKKFSIITDCKTGLDVISRLVMYFLLSFSNTFVNLLSPTVIAVTILLIIAYIVNILPSLGYNSDIVNKIRFGVIVLILVSIIIINIVYGVKILQEKYDKMKSEE